MATGQAELFPAGLHAIPGKYTVIERNFMYVCRLIVMEKLNLPDISATIRSGRNGKPEIFDRIRKKYIRLTPEEWVRQHFLQYMVHTLGFPETLIIVEAAITYNTMKRRFDILACRSDGSPGLVVECKAPGVKLTQEVFDQVAMYNMTLEVEYLVVTNGLSHYACMISRERQSYAFLPEIPAFEVVNQTTKSKT
jgi:hypothetical protein